MRSLLRARALALRTSLGTAMRFAVVGIIKAAIDFGLFNLILFASPTGSGPTILFANTTGFSVAIASSFLLNARYTFRVRARRRRFWRYVAVSLMGLALYNGALALLLAVWDPEGIAALNVAKAASLVASTAWNFLGYRYLVFRSDPAADAEP